MSELGCEPSLFAHLLSGSFTGECLWCSVLFSLFHKWINIIAFVKKTSIICRGLSYIFKMKLKDV